MIKDIVVNLTDNHEYNCDCIIIARKNENHAARLKIVVPEDLMDKWLYVDFTKPDGTKIKTPRIDIDSDGNGYYDICNNLTDVVGKLQAEILFQNEVGHVWKSFDKTYQIADSICATDEIEEEHPDFITEAQNTLDNVEALKSDVEAGLTPTIGENGNWFILDNDTGKPSRGIQGVGISNIEKTNTSDLVDTYTITYTDDTTTTFQVTNGAKGETGTSVTGIEKTATSGLVDTYTMSFSDGNTTNYDITNGADGEDGFTPVANVETDGANSVVTITDELGTTTATIHTPVRGTDYWTNNDKESVIQDVLNSDEIGQIETDVGTANTNADEAKSLARQCNKAKGYANYQTLINELNSEANDTYLIGQSFLIQTMNVPDLWVYSIETTSTPYTYVDDATLVNTLQTNGYIQIGYYNISMLETIKQDLTNYVKNTDYATASTGGVIKVYGTTRGTFITDGALYIAKANNSDILAKTSDYKPIVPSNLDYAMSTNYLTGTVAPTTTTVAPFVGALYVDTTNNATYQCTAITDGVYTWVKLIRETDYAINGLAGAVKTGSGGGVIANSAGFLNIVKSTNSDIDERLQNCKPIVPSNLNYAVGSVLPIMTQADYDAITTKDENLYYCIEEEE